MLDQVEQFCALLRDNGVRVSTAETIDAARAVDAVGVADASRLRAALAVTLVKRDADREVFSELFDLYFRRGGALVEAVDETALAEALRAAGLDDAALAEALEALAREATRLGPVARAGMGFRAAEIARLVAAAGAEIQVERITTPLQVGFYSYRLMDALDVRGAEAAASGAVARVAGGMSAGAREAAEAAVTSGFQRLRAAVRRYVDEQFRQRNLDFMQELAISSLSDKPLGQLSDADVDNLRVEVARLARVLRARVSLRRRIEQAGRLDLSRTLRRSLGTGGVPFDLVLRKRQRRKPRLVVLCDVSDSVKTVSRFMLQMVYLLHELFDRVESFAFVAEIGELTELFKRHDIDRALELAASGAAVNVFANSNYGRALDLFAERYMSKITPRTTVLVIGDGRNNYNPSRASVLAEVHKRAKQVWWLNPESPAAWGFGDSVMHEYSPHCDRVVVASSLESLRKVIDELVL